jgi:hypothetical protein
LPPVKLRLFAVNVMVDLFVSKKPSIRMKFERIADRATGRRVSLRSIPCWLVAIEHSELEVS